MNPDPRVDPETSLAPAQRRRRTLACALVVALLVALDLWSKSAVWAWFEPLRQAGEMGIDAHGHARYELLGGWLGIMTNRNYGAAFGQLDKIPYLLIIGRVLAVILLGWLVHRAPRAQRAYVSALVLIMSGALGNLYDNLLKPLQPMEGKPFGPVRDFIDVWFQIPTFGLDWHFPTFNVADSCITCGALLLLASGFFAPKSKAGEEASEASEAPADEREAPVDERHEPPRVSPPDPRETSA